MSEREGKVERRDDMEIRFPFGGSIRASGRVVIWIILALGLAGLGVWHDVKSTQQNTAVIEALQGLTYVIHLPETERKKLRLDMPESLRQRIQRAEERRVHE